MKSDPFLLIIIIIGLVYVGYYIIIPVQELVIANALFVGCEAQNFTGNYTISGDLTATIDCANLTEQT